jgi:outer membrane assembly lipoprotein YfiO
MKYTVVLGIVLMLACSHFTPIAVEQQGYGYSAERAAELYEQGNTYFKENAYQNAIPKFEEVVENYKNTSAYEPSLYLLAFSHYKLKEFEEASSFGERFIKEFPTSAHATTVLSLIGESYYQLTQDYEATYYLTKYYLETDDIKGREKAYDRIMLMLPELSIKELEKLHRTFMAYPIDEHMLYNLAQIEAREGKKREAERDFNLLVRRFPNTDYAFEVEEYKRFMGLGEASGRCGVLLPLTGEYAQLGQRLMEIVEIFEKKLILPFSIHVIDTKSDPIEAILAASRLIETMHVDFIIAPIRLVEVFGVCAVASGEGVPVVLPMTSESRFEVIPLVYTTGLTQEEQARLIARYAMYDLGLKTFAILQPDQPKYENIGTVFANEIVRNNRQVLAVASFQQDSVTLKVQLEHIAQLAPEAIFLPMDKDMIINATAQIAYYGLEGIQILGIDTFEDEKVPRLGERYVEGAIFAASAPIDSLTMREFSKTGFTNDDFAAKFFTTLWKLRLLSGYSRSSLPDRISNIIKGKKVAYVRRIHDGEFVKLTEIAE